MPRMRLPDRFPKDIRGFNVGLLPAPPGVGGSGQPLAPPARQILPWWDFKPPGGQDFFAAEKAEVLPAVAGTTIALPDARFQTPGEALAVVKAISIFIDNPTLLTDVDWTFRINDGPKQGWDRLTTFPRVATNLSIDFGGTIICPQGALLTMTATNNAATGPWTVGAAFTGWYVSRSQLVQLYGEDMVGS